MNGATGRLTATMESHIGTVPRVAISADGRTIVSSGADRYIVAADGKQLHYRVAGAPGGTPLVLIHQHHAGTARGAAISR